MYFYLCNKFGIKTSKKIRSHSVQQIVGNKNAEIRVDTRIKTDIKVQCNKPDLFVFDKLNNEITLIEVGITSLTQLQTVEVEKKIKYDLLANEISLIYKAKVKIIPFVLTWDGIVTTYHKKYEKELGITRNISAYIQSVVIKKTLQGITFNLRRGEEEITDQETIIRMEGEVKTNETLVLTA